MMKRVLRRLLFLLCLPLGCSDLGPETSGTRVIWNWSIDGVRLGDDSATVIRRLGPANYMGIGDFAGYTLFYTTGPHAGLSITILTRSTRWGMNTRSVVARAPYTGTTKQGIGLGTTQRQLIHVLGPPTRSSDFGDEYSDGVHLMSVRYDSGRVHVLELTDPFPH